MKGKYKYILSIIAAMGILLIIYDGKTATDGVKNGIDLCIRTVIPALFPFFVLNGFMIGTFSDTFCRIFRPIGKMCRIPIGAESIFAMGLLGGYPIGAQAVCTGYTSGQLSKQEARRMLTFSNNPGPAFIFGIVGCIFKDMIVPWVMWCIIIVTAIITALLQPISRRTTCKIVHKSNGNPMVTAIKAMAIVCGWVIFFRVWISILGRWFFWLIPAEISIIITGLLELSNGISSVIRINNHVFQFCCTAAMLSFGGICVGLQTAAVAGPIVSKQYLLSKLFQMFLSIFLSYWVSIVIFHAPVEKIGISICLLSTVMAVYIGYFLRKNSTGNYVFDDI